jgi:hypothetical protein
MKHDQRGEIDIDICECRGFAARFERGLVFVAERSAFGVRKAAG